jgi:predicted small lipoprotein YifL
VSGLGRARLGLVAVALLATLAACGKKAELEPPDNAKVSYTYPRQYPNPGTVSPGAEPDDKTRERPPPPTAGGLSPFPTDRTTTTIYRSGPPQ